MPTDPTLRQLYAAGVRSLQVSPASTRGYVRATQSVRIKLPGGKQATATAQTDITGPRLTLLITEKGEGLVWCETASQTEVPPRTVELYRSRPSGRPTAYPIKTLLLKDLGGGIVEVYVGGDREVPTLIDTLEDADISTLLKRSGNITNTGPSVDDWSASLYYRTTGNVGILKTYSPDYTYTESDLSESVPVSWQAGKSGFGIAVIRFTGSFLPTFLSRTYYAYNGSIISTAQTSRFQYVLPDLLYDTPEANSSLGALQSNTLDWALLPGNTGMQLFSAVDGDLGFIPYALSVAPASPVGYNTYIHPTNYAIDTDEFFFTVEADSLLTVPVFEQTVDPDALTLTLAGTAEHEYFHYAGMLAIAAAYFPI